MTCESPLVVRLVEDTLGELVLDGSNGFVPRNLDLGSPVVRVVAEDRTDADGADDRTARFGARAVSLEVLLKEEDSDGLRLQQMQDAVKAYLNPSLRPWLYYRADEADEERRVRLRATVFSEPLVAPLRVFRVMQVQWAGPDGVQEAATETETSVTAAEDVEAGLEFPITFPIVFPESVPVGTVTVTNEGNVTVYPVLDLWGPCVDPKVENQTTGRAMEFTGLTLASDEWLELDTRARTILLNGTTSRYASLDFAASAWWGLRKGANVLRYYPASFDTGAHAVVRHRSAWL